MPPDPTALTGAQSRHVLAVSGLARETAIARRAGAVAVASGGQVALLRQRLDALDPATVSCVVSFGLAGALVPDLPVGTVLLATEIRGDRTIQPVAPGLLEACRAGLQRRRIAWREVAFVGVDLPVMDAPAKAALAAASEAAAVDMESHVAAHWAWTKERPFAAIRVVSDASDRSLPPLAATAMRPDGSIDLRHVARELLRAPGQIPGLVATGRDAAVAFRALGGVGGLLGELVGQLVGLDL